MRHAQTPLAHGLVARPWHRALWVDLLALLTLVLVVILTGSFTLLAQAVRYAGFALTHAIAALGARLARGRRPGEYQFGLEKLGRCCELLLGLALVASALWLIRVGPELTLAMARQAPALLAFVATANLAWLLWIWPEEQRRSAARVVNVAAQVVLTLAAVPQDAHVGHFGALVAGVLLASVSLIQGLRITIDSVHDLIDRPVDAETLLPVLEALEGADIPLETISRLRSRQVGQRFFIELHLRVPSEETLPALTQRLRQADRAVAAAGHSVDLVFKVH